MRKTLTALALPAIALTTVVIPAAEATAGTSTVNAWPERCSYSRINATQARARCLDGGGFYRVILICRSTGLPPKWSYGPWRLPGGITKPDSVGTCPNGYTVSADDVGVEVKPD